MKLLLLLSLCLMGITTLYAQEKKYLSNTFSKNMSVEEKKKRFFTLLVPAVQRVYRELEDQYEEVKQDLQHHTNSQKIVALKKKYNVKTDEELLIAMKPHPVSIALAQAAMESGWGTSRFFTKANNIFGVRSTNIKQKRVAAGEKRGTQTIWVRKYDSLEKAIRHYYFMLSTIPEYKSFKQMNYERKPATEIVKGLQYYSERGDAYIKELQSMIRYNKLTKYDTKVAK